MIGLARCSRINDQRRGRPRREQRAWLAHIEEIVLEAIAGGQLPDSTDARRLAFELNAIMIGADANFVLLGEPSVVNEGRAAARRRLNVDG